MDQGLDTGPVLVRAQVAVADSDTTGTLTSKLSLIGARLLQEVLVYWPRGELTPRPQNEAEATFSRPVAKEEGTIDWQLTAVDLWRRVRAFQPWPGCYTTYRGRRLKILAAVPLPGNGAVEAGRVVALSSAVEKGQCTFHV